jgi:hypothetical protein
MKNIWILFLGLLFMVDIQAQELNVNVTINTPKLQTADASVFEDLEREIAEFMNNQKWTNDAFEEEERIKAEIVITISDELSQTSFKAEVSIQSVRPVFGSNYETALMTHQDKDVIFTYNQFQPLEYTENVFTDNLTAVLAFYANIIIGMDYDSFSPFGGEPYFQKAQDIVNNIPPTIASQVPGWRSTDGNRNRYWIIENLLSPRTRPYRQAMYDYHRQALDVMHEDAGTGLAVMASAIAQVGEVNRSYPNAMIIQMFSNAKRTEVIEIFKGSSNQQKEQVVAVMQKVDPSSASEYRKMRGR